MITNILANAIAPLQDTIPADTDLPYFQIREYPDSALRTPCIPILKVFRDDIEMQTIFAIMEKTMMAYKAAGLAANQVGVFFRVICVLIDGKAVTMVNPVVTDSEAEEKSFNEGCLSFPSLQIVVRRSTEVCCNYLDRQGRNQTVVLRGTEAQAVQHEIDHLNGLTFLDRIPAFHRRGILEKMRVAQRKAVSENKRMEVLIKTLKRKNVEAVKYGSPPPTSEQPTVSVPTFVTEPNPGSTLEVP